VPRVLEVLWSNAGPANSDTAF